jgi:hypothetical protein
MLNDWAGYGWHGFWSIRRQKQHLAELYGVESVILARKIQENSHSGIPPQTRSICGDLERERFLCTG